MRVERGDLWDYWRRGWKVVVTTNIGWDDDWGGRNNMGAGMALQAWRRFPPLAEWYGAFCKRHGAATPVTEVRGLGIILFPVKPLRVECPAYSWDQMASLERIQQSLVELESIQGPIAMAYPGCGNGSLLIEDVHPLLERASKSRGALQNWELVVVDQKAKA